MADFREIRVWHDRCNLCGTRHSRRQEDEAPMYPRDDRYEPGWSDDDRWHGARRRHGRTDPYRTGRRLTAYLRSRPAESWLFFAAGFALAAILT